MQGVEELHERLTTMQRELEALRTETTHANLLLAALDALLVVDPGEDHFASVFRALRPVFDFSHALVLIGHTDDLTELECVVSDEPRLVGSVWPLTRHFRKVLDGRIVTTIAEYRPDAWPLDVGHTLSRTQPALYLPLRVQARHGLIMLLREDGRPGFDRTHVALARKFALLASHAFAARHASQAEAEGNRLKELADRLKESQAELTRRANYDPLTGLPNRVHVKELIDRALTERAPGRQLALAFIDLDDFKRVNDLYGHSAGDALLKAVADRLRESVREGDIVGRISGDEFVVMLTGRGSDLRPNVLAERLVTHFREPLSVEGRKIAVSASIGIARYPTQGEDYESLRRNADTAMYQAKTRGKGGVSFFNRDIGQAAADRLTNEQQLREAIEHGWFRCAFQPKVNLHTGVITGFEVLARCLNEDGIRMLPGQFIPLAGELGLLGEITDLVLADTLRGLGAIDALVGDHTLISVNVSARQAADVLYMKRFAERLDATGSADRFMLELTEDAFVATSTVEHKILPMLREVGVGLSIDDFGTGFSSLSTLADITADEVKIDRSFIERIHRRPRSQSILRALSSLCEALGINVVAEGIETEAENDYIKHRTGIEVGQGFLFCKPLLVGQLLEQIGDRRMPVTQLAGSRKRLAAIAG